MARPSVAHRCCACIAGPARLTHRRRIGLVAGFRNGRLPCSSDPEGAAFQQCIGLSLSSKILHIWQVAQDRPSRLDDKHPKAQVSARATIFTPPSTCVTHVGGRQHAKNSATHLTISGIRNALRVHCTNFDVTCAWVLSSVRWHT